MHASHLRQSTNTVETHALPDSSSPKYMKQKYLVAKAEILIK